MVWSSPTKAWDLCDEQRQADLRVAWGLGRLRYKLDPNQRPIYDAIRASHHKTDASINRVFCMDISRQVGKDFVKGTLASETCLRNRRTCRVVYAAPTREEVKSLLVPTLEAIFADCPPELRPREIREGTFTKSANELTFPWGAKIVLVGVDMHPNRLRGPATLAFFFTECGFVDNLGYLMRSVLLPQLLTQPEGFGVMGSTPPVTPSHEWTVKYLPEAKQRGMYARSIIIDCPRFTPANVVAMMEESGAPSSIAAKALGFKDAIRGEDRQKLLNEIVQDLLAVDATECARELFAEHVVEKTLVVVPEMQRMKGRITIDSYKRPLYTDCYTVIDPGFSHATGGIFYHLDFERACIVVEGDFARQGQNTREIARLIYAREWQLWGVVPTKPDSMKAEAWEQELELIKAEFYPGLTPPSLPVTSYQESHERYVPAPYLRISDTEPRLIADLEREHGLSFTPAQKPGLDTAVNNFRLALSGQGRGEHWTPKVLVHRRCVNVLLHWEHALWNKAKTAIALAPGGHHYDCLPCGIYGVRGTDWGRNPNPPPWLDVRDPDPAGARYREARREARRQAGVPLEEDEMSGFDELAATWRSPRLRR